MNTRPNEKFCALPARHKILTQGENRNEEISEFFLAISLLLPYLPVAANAAADVAMVDEAVYSSIGEAFDEGTTLTLLSDVVIKNPVYLNNADCARRWR